MITTRIGLSGYKTTYKEFTTGTVWTTTGATHYEAIKKMLLLIHLTNK
jgi:hypothetical protein